VVQKVFSEELIFGQQYEVLGEYHMNIWKKRVSERRNGQVWHPCLDNKHSVLKGAKLDSEGNRSWDWGRQSVLISSKCSSEPLMDFKQSHRVIWFIYLLIFWWYLDLNSGLYNCLGVLYHLSQSSTFLLDICAIESCELFALLALHCYPPDLCLQSS
jgi:hypothetical protein